MLVECVPLKHVHPFRTDTTTLDNNNIKVYKLHVMYTYYLHTPHRGLGLFHASIVVVHV
mgnify:CR=1 FL=1